MKITSILLLVFSVLSIFALLYFPEKVQALHVFIIINLLGFMVKTVVEELKSKKG